MLRALRAVAKVELPPLRAVDRRLARAANVHDFRRIAKRRLPGGVFDYIDGGAEDELTLRASTEAYRRTEFRPRVLRGVATGDASTTLLGARLPLPLVLAPTGFTRIAHPAGELAVARAAGRAGLPYALSTLSTRSIEEVAAVATGPLWFQVYVWRDRDLVRSMIERAAAAGYAVLCLTVDSVVLGRRERDVRRGFTLPPRIGPGTLIDGILHPGWTWEFVRAEPIEFANLRAAAGEGGAISLAQFVHDQYDTGLSWHDVEWLRSVWDGPIVIKGIQTVEDAKIAVAEGVEGIVLSNHGGRQLDTAPVTLDLLRQVRDALGDGPVLIADGGVRRGSDIVKAVALGADAAMAGRAYLYGLGACGERGVDRVLELLAEDMARTMGLLGCATLADLTPDLVRVP
jgi:L-lactate dehydrogenase (cytochrome)